MMNGIIKDNLSLYGLIQRVAYAEDREIAGKAVRR